MFPSDSFFLYSTYFDGNGSSIIDKSKLLAGLEFWLTFGLTKFIALVFHDYYLFFEAMNRERLLPPPSTLPPTIILLLF